MMHLSQQYKIPSTIPKGSKRRLPMSTTTTSPATSSSSSSPSTTTNDKISSNNNNSNSKQFILSFAVMITYVQLCILIVLFALLIFIHTTTTTDGSSHFTSTMIPTCDAWVVVPTTRRITKQLSHLSSSSSQLFGKHTQLRQRQLQEPYRTTKRYYSDDTNEATTATTTRRTTKAASRTMTAPVGERNRLSRISFFPKTKTTELQNVPKVSTNNRNTAATNSDTTLVDIPSHGMPWTESISEQYNKQNNYQGLFYMPFYIWQQSYMQQHLINLQQHPVLSKSGRDMSFIQRTLKNTNITIRMHTATYSSNEYKYIRCTTIDGGSNIQVYTSVWYPRNTSVPILGCDLLQFNNGTKTICIVDFQPITNHTNSLSLKATNGNHHKTTAMMNINDYTSKLQSIRNQYPLLQNTMTNRFYSMNDTYFSKEMLLGRCCDSKSNSSDTPPATAACEMVYDQLFPAYQQYVKIHVETQQLEQQQQQQQQLTQLKEQDQYEKSLQQYHCEYDTYSATHDPAHALLIRYFGQEFADEYVYDILFPSSSVPVS